MNQHSIPTRGGVGRFVWLGVLAASLFLAGAIHAPAAAKAKVKPVLKGEAMKKVKVSPKKKQTADDQAEDKQSADDESASPKVKSTPTPQVVSLRPKMKQPKPQVTPRQAPQVPDEVAVAKSADVKPAKSAPTRELANRSAEDTAKKSAARAEARRDAGEQKKADDLAARKLAAAQKAEEERKVKAEADRLASQKALAETKSSEETRVASRRKTSEKSSSSSKRTRSRASSRKQDKTDEEDSPKPERDVTASKVKPVEEEFTPPAKEKEADANAVDESKVQAVLAAAPSPAVRAQLEQLIPAIQAPAARHALASRLGDVDMALNDPAAATAAYEIAYRVAPNAEAGHDDGVKLARAAAAHGDFQSAARQWAALRTEDDTPEPKDLSAEALALAAQSDYENSAKVWAQFETAAASAPPELKAEALLGQALTVELQGKRENAQQLLHRLVKDYANTPQAALAQKRLDDLKDPVIPQ